MATKKKITHRYPMPSIQDPYTYLKTLRDNPNPNTPEKNIVNKFDEIITKEPPYLQMQNIHKNMDEALSFLHSVTITQKEHELNLIDYLIKLLDPEKEGDTIRELQRRLEDSKSINFNYLDFINLLNDAMTKIGVFKQELSRMLDPATNADPRRNLANSFETLLGDYIGRRSEFYYSQEELIRLLTWRFLERDKGQQFLTSLSTQKDSKHIVAAAAMLQTTLATFFYSNKDLLKQSKDFYKDSQEFMAKFNELATHLDEFAEQTHIEDHLYNNTMLLQVEEQLGIHLGKAKKGRTTKKSIAAAAMRQEIAAILPKSYSGLDPILMNGLQKIRIDFKDQNKISLVEELTSITARFFNGGKHLGRLKGGTDIIYSVGKIEETVNFTNNDPVQNSLENLKKQLSKNKTIEKPHETAQVYVKEITQLDQKLQQVDKCFLIHESTKFYQSVEKGRWFRDQKGFSGRNMNLFTYINSMAEFNADLGFTTDWLKFIAYQLSTDALLDSALVAPLETYFAIFGGIIMFDDFAIIAREAVSKEQLRFSKVENIHLYKLQDGYYPASYFLEQTYNKMREVADLLENGNAVSAIINQPTIDYYNKIEGAGGPGLASRWSKVRNIARLNTKIKLVFAASFLELAAQLLES